MNWIAVVLVILVQVAIAGAYMVRLNAYDHGKVETEPSTIPYLAGIWIIGIAALVVIAVGA